MGALCGKKAGKKAYDIPLASQIPGNQAPKPKVYNPNLDKSANKSPEKVINNNKSLQNQIENKSTDKKSEKPAQKSAPGGSPTKPNKNELDKKNINGSPKKPQKNDLDKINNEKNAQFELNMSPMKSPVQSERNKKNNLIKEAQEVTPQIMQDINDKKSAQKDLLPRQNEELVFLEPERNLILEGGEFVGKALFGEEEFIWPEEKKSEEIDKFPIESNIKLLIEAKPLVHNYFELDIFDVLQTFEPEEDESESQKGHSDIHELNSSGIQYKEEEYGNSNDKHKNLNDIKSNNQKKEEVMELNNEIIEEKLEESHDIHISYQDYKASERPETYPVRVLFPEEKKNEDYDPYGNNQEKEENFGTHNYYEENQKEEEEEKKEEDSYGKKEFKLEEALNFFDEDEENLDTPYDDNDQNNDNQNIGADLGGFKESQINMDKVDEDFFMKTDKNNQYEESRDEENENPYNNNQDNQSFNNQEENIEAPEQNNDYSYEVTPEKPRDRVSYKPTSESLRKKMIWWSSQKS